MCLVLYAWLSEQQYFKEYTNINTLHALRDKTEDEIEQDLAPFGFMEDGREDYDDTYEQYNPHAWLWQEQVDF
jgi:hypothetical protein